MLVHAFQRSIGTGFIVLLLPIYCVYYGFSQFEHRWKGLVLAGQRYCQMQLIRQAGWRHHHAPLHQVSLAIARQVLIDQFELAGPLREVVVELPLLLAGQQGILVGHSVEVLAQRRAGHGGQQHPGEDSGSGPDQRREQYRRCGDMWCGTLPY